MSDLICHKLKDNSPYCTCTLLLTELRFVIGIGLCCTEQIGLAHYTMKRILQNSYMLMVAKTKIVFICPLLAIFISLSPVSLLCSDRLHMREGKRKKEKKLPSFLISFIPPLV